MDESAATIRKKRMAGAYERRTGNLHVGARVKIKKKRMTVCGLFEVMFTALLFDMGKLLALAGLKSVLKALFHGKVH